MKKLKIIIFIFLIFYGVYFFFPYFIKVKINPIPTSTLIYDKNKKHIRIATLPNMWKRTLTIGSAGKTFSSTGFKIGWTIGPKNLIRSCQIVHLVDFSFRS